jgi:hypothetical protein
MRCVRKERKMKITPKKEKRGVSQSDSVSQTKTACDLPESSDKRDPEVELSAPQAWEVKERLKADRRNGPIRPLDDLAGTEVALHKRSEILAEFSKPTQSCPPTEMLINRIIEMVDLQCVPRSLQKKMRREIISLYRALDPIDATDSMLVLSMVAMHLSSMRALLRGARTLNPQALVVNYRHAENAVKAIMALSDTRMRRRNPTTVTVGNVNVNSGVQAIIGSVEVTNSGDDVENNSE